MNRLLKISKQVLFWFQTNKSFSFNVESFHRQVDYLDLDFTCFCQWSYRHKIVRKEKSCMEYHRNDLIKEQQTICELVILLFVNLNDNSSVSSFLSIMTSKIVENKWRNYQGHHNKTEQAERTIFWELWDIIKQRR